MASLQQEDIARRVAARLANELDPGLPRAVEEELLRVRQEKQSLSTDESIEVVMLGLTIATLVVQIASFAVQIRDALRKESKPLLQEEDYDLRVQKKFREMMKFTSSEQITEYESPEKQKKIKRIAQVVVWEILDQDDS